MIVRKLSRGMHGIPKCIYSESYHFSQGHAMGNIPMDSFLVADLPHPTRCTCLSEAKSLLGLRQKVWLHPYSSRSCKNVVLARHIELLSIANYQIAKHGFLSSQEHTAATSQQICRILPILFKSSRRLYL